MRLDLKSIEYNIDDPFLIEILDSHAKAMNHLLDCIQMQDNRIRKCETKLRERGRNGQTKAKD